MGKDMTVKKFLKQYKNKQVNVRVIDVKKITQLPPSFREKFKSNIDSTRFYECTFDSKKLNEPKKKHRLFQYKLNYSVGDVVTAYLVNSKDSKIQKAEINPLFKAQINPESGECIANDVADEHGIARAIPVLSSDGEAVKGKVTSINVSKKAKVLRIDLENSSPVCLFLYFFVAFYKTFGFRKLSKVEKKLMVVLLLYPENHSVQNFHFLLVKLEFYQLLMYPKSN